MCSDVSTQVCRSGWLLTCISEHESRPYKSDFCVQCGWAHTRPLGPNPQTGGKFRSELCSFGSSLLHTGRHTFVYTSTHHPFLRMHRPFTAVPSHAWVFPGHIIKSAANLTRSQDMTWLRVPISTWVFSFQSGSWMH